MVSESDVLAHRKLLIWQRSLRISTSTPTMSSGSNTRTQYSTSSFAGETYFEKISSFTTDDTLDMITSPWTTESWESDTVSSGDPFNLTFSSASSDKLILLSSVSFQPKSTSSYGPISVANCSLSRNTLTVFNNNTLPRGSVVIQPMVKLSKSSGTLSSWTVESFWSDGRFAFNSGTMKPWCFSPYSMFSETDLYPSTLESKTFVSTPTMCSDSFDIILNEQNILVT
ncbi:unnamed protein product [Pieris macdunnoughi]|uniref:Uncharacterized protein n=1 Tax=Pieris macdunnoughi TaxID=345717 RepID=A0A821SXH9_9NEOP|nr:unnamed protein product [Pieris macdunnoughi]